MKKQTPMKLFSIIVLAFFAMVSSGELKAQSIYMPNTTILNSNLKPFVGEWIWSSGSDVFKLYLFTEVSTYPGNIRVENLVGFHYYEKDGKIIDSSYENLNSNPDLKKATVILGSPQNDKSGNVLKGGIVFSSSKTHMDLNLTYDPTTKVLNMSVINTISGIGFVKVNPTSKGSQTVQKKSNDLGVLPKSFSLKKSN